MSKKRQVSIFMPEELILQSRVEAAKLNMSRSAFVTKAVRQAIHEAQADQGQQPAGGRQQKSEARR